MNDDASRLGHAFRVFLEETPAHAAEWLATVEGLDGASALDRKTAILSYLAVIAALRLDGELPMHVERAKKAGASRAEVASAILVGLPAAGNGVIECLPAALTAYDGP